MTGALTVIFIAVVVGLVAGGIIGYAFSIRDYDRLIDRTKERKEHNERSE
jgi:hypothetical protein